MATTIAKQIMFLVKYWYHSKKITAKSQKTNFVLITSVLSSL